MSEEIKLLREMRDLLLVIAEPALAKRDERLRESLGQIVGKSEKTAAAVRLMNGERSQRQIIKECGIDAGNLSRCVKALREAGLIEKEGENPKLLITVPSGFFEQLGVKKK